MSKRIDLIEEIQELIQQIKNEYQEGIDYKFLTWNELHKKGISKINIFSPHLKQHCRNKFHLPPGVNDWLEYLKEDADGNFIYYKTLKTYKHESLRFYHKTGTVSNREPEEKTPRNCAVCNKLIFGKNGLIKLLNSEVKYIDYGEVWKPSVLAYLHPECSKKYFANKKYPNKNDNIRIKEKLLRNLDKICLDPMGDLANAELLKQENAEWYYKKGNYGSGGSIGEWIAKAHHVEIESEEIDLDNIFPGLDGYYEIKKALIEEIKQNLSEWKIMEGGEKCMGSNNWIVKHQSGRRHWKLGFRHIWDDKLRNEMRKEWDQIEAVLNGSKSPDELELERLKTIFQLYNINKITFENEELFIEYDNNSNERTVSDQEFQELKNMFQKNNKKEITKEQLNDIFNTNDNNNSKYLWLIGGIVSGTIVLYLFLIFYFLCRKRKIK